MNEDILQGKSEKAVGHIKQATGEVTGDKDLQAEGAADLLKGEFHKILGAFKKVGKDVEDGAKDGADAARENAEEWRLGGGIVAKKP